MFLVLDATMSRFALSTQNILILDRAVKLHCLQDGTHNTRTYSVFWETEGEQKSTHPYSI